MTPVFDVHPVLTSDGNGFEASVTVLLPSGEELWMRIPPIMIAQIAAS